MNRRSKLAAFGLALSAFWGLWMASGAAQVADAAENGENEAQELRRSVEADPAGVVQIHNLTGSLVVTGWDQPRVEVVGSVGLDVRGLLLERRGDRVVVRPDQGLRKGTDADLQIRVPRASALEIEGVSTDVRVSEVAGRVDLEVISGTLRITGPGNGNGTVRLLTVSGVADLDGAFRQVEVESTSGPVRLRGSVERTHVTAVNGPVALRLDGARRVEVDTVSGPVVLDLASGSSTEASIALGSFAGSLDLVLGAEQSAHVVASTQIGRIVDGLGGEAESDEPNRVERRVGGVPEDGQAARIELESFSGDITLRRR